MLRSFSLALACYTALSVWFHWDLVRAPGTVLPQPVGIRTVDEPLSWGDEQMVASTIAIVARRLMRDPARLFDLGQCWPFPNSLSLGEPMFVDALLATVPIAITGNPIVGKNFVTVTAPILAGLAMFALILYWTGSTAGALVAGLLFGFHPQRLIDVSHPYVFGNAWTPLALLASHRLFARRRWRDAALLAVALVLQMLESFYPALAFAMVGGVYGTALAVHHRRVLPSLLPKLAAVVIVVALVGLLAFRPYLGNREAWGILEGRYSTLLQPTDFMFGGRFFLGTVLIGLAAVGLYDRLRRGAGIVFDPRLPLLAGGVFVYWFVVWVIAVPFVTYLPSPYVLGMRNLPGINAVRAVTAVRSALPFVAACLAGFGVAALLRRRAHGTAVVVATLFLLLGTGEIFFFRRAGGQYGVQLRSVAAKPSAPLLALLDRLPEGPVLDYPPSRYIPPSTHYVFLHGFHDRPTDACHSSFPSPMLEEVYAMSSRLPSSLAALRLRTLGFRSIVVHTEYLEPERVAAFRRWAARDGWRAAGLHALGEADGHIVYAFGPPPASIGFEALEAPVGVPRRVQVLNTCGRPIDFVIRNAALSFYRHPEPLRPDAVVLEWENDDKVTTRDPRTVLLPLALTPGGRQTVKIVPSDLPPPGAYVVTLRRNEGSGQVLARQRVLLTG
jgi:hypothetical protein